MIEYGLRCVLCIGAANLFAMVAILRMLYLDEDMHATTLLDHGVGDQRL